MNNKSTPNQMRVLLKRMREGYVPKVKPNVPVSSNELTMHEMLDITRKKNVILKEEDLKNKATVYDQELEEKKFKRIFDDMEVSYRLKPLGVYDKGVVWGGSINNAIQFVYKVAYEDSNSGVEFEYLEDFNSDDPENEEIVKRIEDYYDTTFYKYWRDNLLF